jgi:hypothetical protein
MQQLQGLHLQNYHQFELMLNEVLLRHRRRLEQNLHHHHLRLQGNQR